MDWSGDEDVQWMLQAKAGDSSAFEKVIERFQKPLLNFFFRFFGNLELAEDATQQLFVQVYRALPRYSPQSKLSTYLYRVAKNIALNLQRRNSILSFLGIEPAERVPAPLSQNPAPQAEEKEKAEKIQKALHQLPARQRMAILYAYFEDLTADEIAERMECSRSSVESLLFRARETLRKNLQSTQENELS